ARLGLATQEEEAVPVVDAGKVNQRRLAAIGLIEAPHEARQRDVGLALLHHPDRSRAELRCHHADLEPFGGEVAAVDGDRARRVEDRAERLGDSDRPAAPTSREYNAALRHRGPAGPG